MFSTVARSAVLGFLTLLWLTGESKAEQQAPSQVWSHLVDLLQTEERFSLPVQRVRDSLKSYYADNQGTLLWIGTGLMKPFLVRLEGADRDGLRPSSYPADHLKSLMDAEPLVDDRSRAVVELWFSAFFLKYASDIQVGRFVPNKIDPELFWRTSAIDEIKALTSLSQLKNIDQFFNSWQPQNPDYKKLKETLAAYRELQGTGGWPIMEPGRVLKPGMRDPRVKILRKRLSTTDGAQPPGKPEDEDLYEPGLVKAVKKFQSRHGLDQDGIVGKKSLLALNISLEQRIRQIEVSMERWRWMPVLLGRDYIIVNIAGFELRLFRGGKLKDKMNVIVGQPYHRTPVFSDAIKYLEINPYWNVPFSIATKEMLPKLKVNPVEVLAGGFEVLQGDKVLNVSSINWTSYSPSNFPYKLRQKPGPRNALGRVKFMFPNKFNVYLHDTPAHALFDQASRALSHGCIRLQRPIDLAEQVLSTTPDWPRPRIELVLASKERTVVNLASPLPVHLTYSTAWRSEDGEIQFRTDIYHRDARLHQALYGKQTPW